MLECAVVKQTTPAATDTIDFTSAGFGTPTAALFFLCWGDSDGTIREANQYASVGFTDLTSDRCVSMGASDGNATTKTARNMRSDALVAQLLLPDGSVAKYGTFNSTITDGLRIDWTVSSSSAQVKLVCVLIKGSTLEDCGSFTPNSSESGTASKSGLASAPKVLLLASHGSTVDDGTSHGIISFGCAIDDGSETQRCHAWYNQDDSSNVNCGGYLANNRCVGQFYDGSLSWSGELTAWNADGWTMTTRDGATGGDECIYLVLNAPDTEFDLQTIESPTSTETKKYTTGFDVTAVLGAMTHASAVNTAGNDETVCQFAAAEGAGEESVASGDDDGSADSDTYNLTDAKVVATATESGGSYGKYLEAAVDSWDSDGITFDWTTVDGTARLGWMLSFGSSGGAPTTNLLLMRANKRANKIAAYAGKQ